MMLATSMDLVRAQFFITHVVDDSLNDAEINALRSATYEDDSEFYFCNDKKVVEEKDDEDDESNMRKRFEDSLRAAASADREKWV